MRMTDDEIKCRRPDWRKREALDARTWASEWEIVRVPERYRKRKLLPLDGLPHAAQVADYLDRIAEHDRDGRGLLLWGPPGGGKSAIAGYVLSKVIEHCDGWSHPLWLPAADIELSKDEPSDTCGTIFKWACRAPWLVLDDLGMEGGAEWQVRALRRLIKDSRYGRGLPTVVTTNLAPKTWERDYPWFVSLLDEAFVEIEVPGPDKGGVDWRKKLGERALEAEIAVE